MIELESPQIERVEEVGAYAKYEAGPLQAGYGVTIGNALRRVLLSSLEGAAVTSIQIRAGRPHDGAGARPPRAPPKLPRHADRGARPPDAGLQLAQAQQHRQGRAA